MLAYNVWRLGEGGGLTTATTKVLFFFYMEERGEVLLHLFEEAALEDKEVEDAGGDTTVGDVEDEAEEDKLFAAPNGKVGREGGFYEGEVEHINYLSVEEGGVTASFGEELGNLKGSGFAEEEPIKGAVDDVAKGANGDERDSYE